MLSFPHAKINIGLHIVEKRADGYHNIETIFYPLKLRDALEILPSEGDGSFQISGLEINDNPNDNLCLKAFRLLKQDFSKIPNLQMHLHKVIPFGAGLGGGSSDAAFTIEMLNTFFSLGLNKSQKQDYCRKIGSDCAFFLETKPVYAYEKGDRFTDCELNLSAYKLVLVKPSFGISTAEAYAAVHPQKREILLPEMVQKPILEWKNCIENDFEKSLFPRYPQLAVIKEHLYDLGALYASMTGSGSAFFALFNKQTLIPFKKEFPDCFVWEE